MTDQRQESSSTHLFRGASVVAGITIVSRLFGFIRDLVIARGFGAGMAADAFFVAFRIPNLLRSFVAEGALTAAFVPIFSSELHRGKNHAQTALNEIAGLVLVFTVALSLLGIVFAPELTMLFAPGFGIGTDKMKLCVLLTRIMMPFVICVSVVAMANGALSTLKIYGTAAFAQIVMNIALIIGGLCALSFAQTTGVIVLAASVIVGGILQVVVQLPPLKRVDLKLRPVLHLRSPIIAELTRVIFPALAGAGIYQLSIFLITVLASLLAEGSVSWLFYADRVAQLPIGIYSIALASVLLPILSNMHQQENKKQFKTTLNDTLRYTSFFILPTAVALCMLADPLVVLLFERGEFSHHSSHMTAMALRGMSLGIWGVSCHSMVVRGFLAQKDTKTPTVVGAVALLLTIFISLLLMGSAQPGSSLMHTLVTKTQLLLWAITPSYSLGHVGLAVASSVSYTFAFIMLLTLFKRRNGFSVTRFVFSTSRSAIASSIMALEISCLAAVFKQPLSLLAVSIPIGAGTYIIASHLLRSEELTELTSAIRRRLAKRAAKSSE
jgi:putative peptidoglycan lipid II flippase